MLKFTAGLFRLRPREVGFAPPKLIRRPGIFKCKLCEHRWSSDNVWVTEMTRKCYQGETCVKCGTTNKPTRVDGFGRGVFNNAPIDKRPQTSKYLHGFDRRRQKGVGY